MPFVVQVFPQFHGEARGSGRFGPFERRDMEPEIRGKFSIDTLQLDDRVERDSPKMVLVCHPGKVYP